MMTGEISQVCIAVDQSALVVMIKTYSFPRQPLLRSGMTRDPSAKGCQPSNKYKFLDAENKTENL